MPKFSTALLNFIAAFSSSENAFTAALPNATTAPTAKVTPIVLPKLFTFFCNFFTLFSDSKKPLPVAWLTIFISNSVPSHYAAIFSSNFVLAFSIAFITAVSATPLSSA
jgi:hypothetical protein